MSVVTTLPWSSPLTADDYFAMATLDDRQRYELIDGVLVVSPSPFVDHQWSHSQLFEALVRASPREMRVFSAPLDVRLTNDTVVQPDLLVVRADDATGRRLTGVPLLAVEILSDSTRGSDLILKRSRYERAGVPTYWVVDPATLELKVLELDTATQQYAQTAHADLGAAPLSLDRPFPVTLRLSR